ncbi:putative alcohol dehydrogenase [Escherichia coli]|nr:putative alcohol dehydrogenase [Escherichia coli]
MAASIFFIPSDNAFGVDSLKDAMNMMIWNMAFTVHG